MTNYTRSALITFASHIDLPEHDIVLSSVKLWNNIRPVIDGLCAAFVWVLIFKLALNTNNITPIMMFGFSIFILLGYMNDDNRLINYIEKKEESFKTFCFGSSIVIGLITWYVSKDADKNILLSMGVGLIFGVGLFFGTVVLGYLIKLALLPGFIFAAPIKYILAKMGQLYFRLAHAEWRTSTGEPILVFSSDGLSKINNDASMIYVASSNLRRNGKADAEGIPKFTLDQILNNTDYVRQCHTTWSSNCDESQINFHGENPAAGFPVFQDINPGSGLPTIAGIGSQDVAGNTYGTNDNLIS